METVSIKMTSGTFGEERGTKKTKYNVQFEETELRLGLPGADQSADAKINCVDLKLNLSSTPSSKKMQIISTDMDITLPAALAKEMAMNKSAAAKPPASPASKAPVVGWPPVRSFRKNTLSAVANKITTSSIKEESADQKAAPAAAATSYVKVSMDGAPYLRKVDLNMYKTYQDLCDALAKMFCSFTIGNYGPYGMKDFMNDNKLVDLLNGSEYVPTYEDKDGDWMLVGDVPWEMFIESCKRMRIMKGKEAVGLAPRAMEKCKNRN